MVGVQHEEQDDGHNGRKRTITAADWQLPPMQGDLTCDEVLHLRLASQSCRCASCRSCSTRTSSRTRTASSTTAREGEQLVRVLPSVADDDHGYKKKKIGYPYWATRRAQSGGSCVVISDIILPICGTTIGVHIDTVAYVSSRRFHIPKSILSPANRK